MTTRFTATSTLVLPAPQTVTAVKRLVNTVSGGPRYAITFANGVSYQTKPDSTFSYAISPHLIEGRTFVVSMERGKIVDLTEEI